jgi:hypothetical protein
MDDVLSFPLTLTNDHILIAAKSFLNESNLVIMINEPIIINIESSINGPSNDDAIDESVNDELINDVLIIAINYKLTDELVEPTI